MKDHDQQIVHSSEDPNWRTPLDCYRALDAEFRFTLDAAANDVSHLSPFWFGDGGLEPDALATTEWARYTTVGRQTHPIFLNPSFSRKVAAKLKAAGDPSHVWYRIENWARKCWEESQWGATIVGLFPFAPQTEWYRKYVYGHKVTTNIMGEALADQSWSGHAAREERRLPHRISFLRADGSPAANAAVNTAVIVWKPNPGIVGPWAPHSFYWSYQ